MGASGVSVCHLGRIEILLKTTAYASENEKIHHATYGASVVTGGFAAGRGCLACLIQLI